MSDQKKHITKLIKLENNGELKRILGGYELHNDAFSIIENQLNINAESLILNAVDDAKNKNDKTIVSSHSRTAIEKTNNKKQLNEKSPVTEGMKIIGTIGLSVCLTHITYVSQNDNISVNFIIVFAGIIGGLLLGIGLYKK